MEEDGGSCIPTARKQAAALVPLLDEEYLNNRSHWKFIGQCIFNILDEEGKELFESVTPEKFSSMIDDVYESYTKTRHGLSSLRILVEKQNPTEFDAWSQKVVFSAAMGALQDTAGTTELADIAKFMFGHNFLCTGDERKSWYTFNNNRWEKMTGGDSLRQRFSRKLSVLFEKVLKVLKAEDVPQEAKQLFKDLIDRCKTIIRGLKTPAFKNNLMTECSEVMSVGNFEDECDEDYMLFGNKNGVFDLEHDTFREAFPEDLITLQGVEYRDYGKEGGWEHPDVKEVMLFFRKVLHNEKLIHFVLKHESTCLVGGNLDKKCVINIGETAHNGKTTRQKLMKNTFGSYCGKLPLGSIVGRTPDAGAADPAQARTKGQRVVFIDEANQNQNFNFSFVKIATGNDEIYARKLYSNGVQFTPQYTLIMLLNQAPGAKTSDQAIWERLVLVPHDSRFLMDCNDTDEEQWAKRVFKADPFIDKRLKELAPAHFWILKEYWKIYKKEGLGMPDEVADKSRKYKYENDVFAQFIDNRIEKTDNQLDYITLGDFYINFKQWFGDAIPGSKPPDKQSFQKELNRILGEPDMPEFRWRGVKVKTTMATFRRD